MESSVLVQDGDCIQASSTGQSSPPNSPDINSLIGVPQLDPRVGEEYQAEIPSMITEAEGLLMDPADSEVNVNNSHLFFVGLLTPVIWITNKPANPHEDVCKSRGEYDANAYMSEIRDVINETQKVIVPGKEALDYSAEYLDAAVIDGQESKSSVYAHANTIKPKSGKSCRSENCCLVPYVSGNDWTDTEIKGLLLGLFIFRKNFVLIERFLENKEMGEILSFYYGGFYRSDGHRRWSECRKAKSKRTVTGQKLFTGWREQELLSRLLLQIPKELHDNVLEFSKSYAENRASLEEYVFSVKSIVGLPALVEAVGIGKETGDLTRLTTGPGKTKRSLAVSPSMPTGEAWSSIEPNDIIKLLTGGLRLSKARSKDIFWEAVWPRLLARGWHSEQPKTKSFASSKDHLVFLIPGVAKFSSDDLVNGYHYFNSVSDVLSKVVSEPNLLEFEVKKDGDGSYNEEYGWTRELESDSDELSNNNHHLYLKPRASIYDSDKVKFTIVDTSLSTGGKASNVRVLRALPAEKMIFNMTNSSREKESSPINSLLDDIKLKVAANDIPSIDNKSKTDCIEGASCKIDQKTMFTVGDTSFLRGEKSSKVTELRCSPVKLKYTKKILCVSRGTGYISPEDLQEQHQHSVAVPVNDERENFSQNEAQCDYSDDRLERTIKHQFRRRAKAGLLNEAPVSKRRRLTACTNAETNHNSECSSESFESDRVELSQLLTPPDVICMSNPQGNRQETPLTIAAPAKDQLNGSKRGPLLDKFFGIGIAYENEECEIKRHVSLNSHIIPSKSENVDLPAVPMEDKYTQQNDPEIISNTNKLLPEAMRTCNYNTNEKMQLELNHRRQSTRNRPLTKRLLESLECEFLHNVQTGKKRKLEKKKTRSSPSCSFGRKVKSISSDGISSTREMTLLEYKRLNRC